jgi:hypothetical protein
VHSLADSAAAAAGVGGRHANCYSDQDSSTTNSDNNIPRVRRMSWGSKVAAAAARWWVYGVTHAKKQAKQFWM